MLEFRVIQSEQSLSKIVGQRREISESGRVRLVENTSSISDVIHRNIIC